MIQVCNVVVCGNKKCNILTSKFGKQENKNARGKNRICESGAVKRVACAVRR